MSKLNAYFGEFGGWFVPQILVPALDQLEQDIKTQNDDSFKRENKELLKNMLIAPLL